MLRLVLLALVLSFLAGCAALTPYPIYTPYPTYTPFLSQMPSPTYTPTNIPTAKPTKTPTPTKTPRIELEPEHVVIPVESNVTSFIYKYCYVLADDDNDGDIDRFHAGDMIYFYTNFSGVDNGIEYVVLAPIEGEVVSSHLINNTIGWEINVKTPYVIEGSAVWYDIIHADKAANGIREGTYVERGQPMLIVSILRNNGRFEKAIDIAIRNGPIGPNPAFEEMFFPHSYFPISTFFEDDFDALEKAGVVISYENCVGLGYPVPPGQPVIP